MDSGFPGGTFQSVGGTWILVCNCWWDSGFPEISVPDSKAQDLGFHKQIFPDCGSHKQKVLKFRNPDSVISGDL